MALIFEFEGKQYQIDYGLCDLDGNSDYETFLKAVNPQIDKWFFTSEGGYQGEWFAIGYDGKTLFYHQGSFGSCSGCDWLLSITDEKEAIEFLKEMKKLVPIGTTKEEAENYLYKEAFNLCWAKSEIKELIDNIDNVMSLEE